MADDSVDIAALLASVRLADATPENSQPTNSNPANNPLVFFTIVVPP
jgi:hypothetical protein